MSYKIIISPLAKTDIQESMEWYERGKPDLGEHFYEKVKETIDAISNNPYSFAVRYRTFRMAIVKKFPFAVHYTIDDKNKTVPVHAVLHTSRDPKIWEERTS